MTESLFIKSMGNSPQLRVIDFLIENRIFDYSKSDISKETGVSRVTLDKIWGELVILNIIKKTRTVGRATLYRLNLKNSLVKEFIKLDKIITRQYAENLAETQVAFA